MLVNWCEQKKIDAFLLIAGIKQEESESNVIFTKSSPLPKPLSMLTEFVVPIG